MLYGVKSEISKALAHASGATQKAAMQSLSPPQGKFGDLSSTLAFSLAREKKGNPAALAQKIAEKMSAALPPCLKDVKAAGPYLNFSYSDSVWADFANGAQDADFGRGEKKQGKVLIEFPSVNPNKPWHVGHLRNALLGDTVARLLEFSGCAVEREDYIDDLGLQVAQSVWGVENLPKAEGGKFDHMLGRQYVEVAKRLSDPQVEAEVRRIIHELEEGTSLRTKSARATVEKCVAAQYETSFAYDIYHDVLIFESDIVRTIFAEGMALLKSSNALRLEPGGKNAGCYVVPLAGAKGFEGMESPDKILIRSDGTATYTGKDAVFQLWKFGKLDGNFHFVPFLRQPNGKAAYMSSSIGPSMRFGGASKVINVICMDQSYPQKVLKVVLSRLGFAEEAENSIHLSYELVTLPQGKFSGREGTWMAGSEGGIGFTADELLEEGTRLAMGKIRAEIGEEEKKSVAAKVALGAIRFSFLRTSAEKKIMFDWEKALSFEGDSGPYLQYAYARACRILEKGASAGVSPPIDSAAAQEFAEDEKALLSHISQFPDTAERCADSLQAHPMADYALELSSLFSRFYTNVPVLADDVPAEKRASRIAIVAAFKNVLGQALGLLGIPAIERM